MRVITQLIREETPFVYYVTEFIYKASLKTRMVLKKRAFFQNTHSRPQHLLISWLANRSYRLQNGAVQPSVKMVLSELSSTHFPGIIRKEYAYGRRTFKATFPILVMSTQEQWIHQVTTQRSVESEFSSNPNQVSFLGPPPLLPPEFPKFQCIFSSLC